MLIGGDLDPDRAKSRAGTGLGRHQPERARRITSPRPRPLRWKALEQVYRQPERRKGFVLDTEGAQRLGDVHNMPAGERLPAARPQRLHETMMSHRLSEVGASLMFIVPSSGIAICPNSPVLASFFVALLLVRTSPIVHLSRRTIGASDRAVHSHFLRASRGRAARPGANSSCIAEA